jgi:hypothetical protein
MTDSVMGVLNEQLGTGAASASRLADAMRVGGRYDLSRENPLHCPARFRTFARNVDGYADRLEISNRLEQLTQTASDYTRRQRHWCLASRPLPVLCLRTFKNAQSISSHRSSHMIKTSPG